MSSSAVAVDTSPDRMSKISSLPFLGVHLMCAFVFFVPFHWRDVLVCLGLYVLRMWAITAGFHRYFAHRSYKTGRAFQFFLAFVGTLSVQKGVLWWAGHHRNHHRESDQEADIHSPVQRGFWWSHAGWILCPKYNETPFEKIRDFSTYPELRWINKHFLIPPVALAVALFFMGGFSMLVWGFFVSTTLLWHGTFTINSLSHIFGKRRYKTTDTSRNNWLLSLITLGEGWHNNHHYYQNTANQGWFWWEVDVTYYTLRVLSWFGIVSDLRMPTERVRQSFQKYTDEDRKVLAEKTTFRSLGRLTARRNAARARPGNLQEVLAVSADSHPRSNPSPQESF